MQKRLREQARELAKTRRQLAEALEQQTATSDVLRIVSGSKTDVQTVLDAVVERVARLCNAPDADIFLRDGDVVVPSAHSGALALPVGARRPLNRDWVTGRAVLDGETIHVSDLAGSTEFPEGRESARRLGHRAIVSAPMIRDDAVIGALVLRRAEPVAFTGKQIELVQNFAAQAVIAIENARLLTELRQRTGDLSEALEQQTATSEVLKVISTSPGDLEPVFQSMLDNALRICEANFGLLYVREGEEFRIVANLNIPPSLAEYLEKRGAWKPLPGGLLDRAIRTQAAAYEADDSTSAVPSAPARHGDAKTTLTVPMLKDGEVSGAITIFRTEVRPFTNKQIELLQNFAAQAVIAIENARLLTELRQRTNDLSESLEQQTATSEVLAVISASPGEVAPVFETILESATRICDAKFANLLLYQDGAFRREALFGAPQAWADENAGRPSFRPGPLNPIGRMIADKKLVHVPDMAAEPGYAMGDRAVVSLVERAGVRTIVGVPMLKDGQLVGAIAVYRQEVRPFSEKQIELVTNFAAQAVIAIENARLLNELRQRTDDLTESLEQQTATSEVLQVISSSPDELESVFSTILAKATNLCEASYSTVWLRDGEEYRIPAIHGGLPTEFVGGARFRATEHVPAVRAMKTARPVQVSDLRATPAYLNREPVAVAGVEVAGIRTLLAVPMIKDVESVGAITIFRTEIRPFTDKQIDLVQNFAAQAVIAIENARLLNELRQRTGDLSESLEQQTATSEVLKVISTSPGELAPVFQAMLENAIRICDAGFGSLVVFEGDSYRRVALHNAPAALAEAQDKNPIRPFSASPVLHRVATVGQIIHIADILVESPQEAITQLGGARTVLCAPLLKDGRAIGVISIYRQEVRPFTGKQIELVQNFAAQAVIAIENARLLTELRQRTNDLSESLEQQTATSEVLKVISSSPGALEPVFDTVLVNAVDICEAKFGIMFRFEEGLVSGVAGLNIPAALQDFINKTGRHTPMPGTSLDRVSREKKTVHIIDDMASEAPTPAATLGGARSYLCVPLLKDDALVGAITIYRQEVRPFTGKQIELVENFAAQAVIAIENTRLLNELRESLQQQTATSDVLKTISRSTFDLQTVLNALVQSALRLCEAEMGAIHKQQDQGYQEIATLGFPEDYAAFLNRTMPFQAAEGSVLGRTVKEGRAVQVADVLADPSYTFLEGQKRAGFRTVLGVPLIREGTALGAMVLMRKAVSPFSEKQIELVTTFADQAVIAIENVRLFDEIQDKSRQLAEASQHKSQFLANMSHELRTPLNAILGYTELIADGIYGAPNEKMLAALKRLESNGKHLLGLINEVLDLSKIEAGQLKLDLAEYSIQEVAQTVFNAVEPLAADKKLAFRCEIAPGLPQGHGDGRRLTQVLLNLVGNAIKFTDAGEVVVKAGASNGAFNLSVRDTGPGISAADQAKLFQEFQQADNSITKKKGGTGLGLAISKRIVEMHGGRIWLESEVGRGSTFFVALPLQVREQVKLDQK